MECEGRKKVKGSDEREGEGAKGACTYDVCTGRGEGGTPKSDAVRKLSKGGCMKMQTRGDGVKDRKILQTSYVHAP